MMTVSYRKVFELFFTILCIITVAFMMGYWFYKYEVEDRDIGVVDYAQLEDAKEIKFPDVSICIQDPFHAKNLGAIRFYSNYTAQQAMNIAWREYRSYLAGDIYDQILEVISDMKKLIMLMQRSI